MELKGAEFYEVISPRCTALISTVDNEGRVNAAPFSFLTPVSTDPPLVLFAAIPTRHTLANAREIGEFVLNVVPESFLDKLWVCSKAFPKGVNEIKEAGLTERKSKRVKAPSIEECVAWVECLVEFEHEAGNHVLVVGRVVYAECKDEFMRQGKFDIERARPVTHIQGRRFIATQKIIRAKG